MKKYGLVGDISKMFLNVEIDESDKNYLRFLWKDPDDESEDPPHIYRFNSLVFGLSDSPFISNTCIKKIVTEKMKELHLNSEAKTACSILISGLYVDDVTASFDEEKEAIKVKHEIEELLTPAHFIVKKWASNSAKILSTVDSEKRAPTEIVHMHSIASNLTHNTEQVVVSSDTKQLGIRWSPQTDQLMFDVYDDLYLKNQNTKKRLMKKINLLSKKRLMNSWHERKSVNIDFSHALVTLLANILSC